MKNEKFGAVLELPENIIVYVDYNTLNLEVLTKVDAKVHAQLLHAYFTIKGESMLGYFPYRGDEIVALMEKHMNAKIVDRWDDSVSSKQSDKMIVY
jgi:hypothetical protein